MTKQKYAEVLYRTVELANSKDQATEHIKGLLNIVEPTDLEAFAKWGQEEHKSTAKECWQ